MASSRGLEYTGERFMNHSNMDQTPPSTRKQPDLPLCKSLSGVPDTSPCDPSMEKEIDRVSTMLENQMKAEKAKNKDMEDGPQLLKRKPHAPQTTAWSQSLRPTRKRRSHM